jgi:hypothetical protein
MLFDPANHMPLTPEPWSRGRALEAANMIFDFILEGQAPNGLWPAQPAEESEIPFNKSVYHGAAGTLWALYVLGEKLQRPLPFNAVESIGLIDQEYLSLPDTGDVVPSLFLGESGILLIQHWILAGALASDSTHLRLRNCIESNIRNPVNEALWGCPGTMVAALATGQIELYRLSADYLFEQWYENPAGLWIWTQDLYGKKREFVGAGHGFFGNVQALLKGRKYLTALQQEQLLERTAKTAIASARREEGKTSWNAYFDSPVTKEPLVQWCHGAPGAITALSSFPKNYSTELEEILLEAGELIWSAGPLDQGVALCHGTDGNGFALLRLFERTQDEMWLDRARRFAMHAIQQRNGRYTLFTGEAGLALFLLAAVEAKADFPILD